MYVYISIIPSALFSHILNIMGANDAEYDRIMSLSNAEAICDLQKIYQELQRIKVETGKRRVQLVREHLEDKLKQQFELNKIFADMLNSSMKKLAIKSGRLTQLEQEQRQMEENCKLMLTVNEPAAIKPDVLSQRYVAPGQTSSSSNNSEPFCSVRSTVNEPAATRHSNLQECVSYTTAKPEPGKSKSAPLAKSCKSQHTAKMVTMSEDLTAMGKTFGNQRRELLVMCQKIMRPYGIPMYEFSSSWVDGHAFCALIHHYLPHLVDTRYIVCKDANATLGYVNELTKSLGVEFEGNMLRFYKLRKPSFVKTCSFVLKLVVKLEELANATSI